ncbi:MAG: GNAT family N-acetyltransferase [Usitatibacter sp.]
MASVAAQRSRHLVRAASPEDGEALRSLYVRCRLLAEWLPGAEKGKSDFDRDTMGEEVVVSVGEDGAIDGFVSVWRPQRFIHHLYVRPEARRRGVAGALLGALAGTLPFPWRLKCVRANRVAMEFYAKRGWREVAQGSGVNGAYAVLELGR